MESIVFGEIDNSLIYRDRRGVYGIAVNQNLDVLVIKFSKWLHLPGGGIEVNESEKDCLAREFIEETGYSIKNEIKIGDIIQYHYSEVDQVHYKLLGSYYTVELGDKICEPIENNHENQWIDFERAISGMGLPSQSYALKEAKKIAFK